MGGTLPLIITGVTVSVLLTTVMAHNDTQEDLRYLTSHPYPDVTFTTPPDVPLAREYAPYEREYGGSAQEYGAPAREYGAPTREYGAPAREYGAPAREYGAPAREYGAPAREYGAPAREYGSPLRSPYQRYPSPTQDIPPVAEYAPPTGFGMPPPEAFPPTGGILPTRGAYDVTPEVIKTRLYTLFEPAAVLVVGVTVFVLLRHYTLPYLIYWARSLEEEEEGGLDIERSIHNSTTLNILKAITKGVCLSRISCQLGMMAQNYTLKDIAVSAIEEETNPPRLAVIFRDTAMGRVQSCEPYICRRKRVPSEAKHRRRKRNSAKLLKK